MLKNSHIGQVRGPFNAQVDLLDDNQAIGILTPQTQRPAIFKIGIQADPGTVVSINGTEVRIGKTGIYELDDLIRINSIIFPSGATENTIIDFAYTGYMNY